MTIGLVRAGARRGRRWLEEGLSGGEYPKRKHREPEGIDGAFRRGKKPFLKIHTAADERPSNYKNNNEVSHSVLR